MPYRRIFKWLPWRYVIKRVARAQGFIDPISVLSKLHRFAQPSEIQEPMELLRAGVVFHARGLINTKAIQHNLDWVWPFWVERQFDPNDVAFIPRAFSVTHVNLTHRNWTAVGLPDCDLYPIVDPHGLLTPAWDGWSIDAWVLSDDHGDLIPSRELSAEQQLLLEDNLRVKTRSTNNVASLESLVWLEDAGEVPANICRYRVESQVDGLLVISVRPYNPEGVSFIHDISIDPSQNTLIVDGAPVEFSEPADGFSLSEYYAGDVYHLLKQPKAMDSKSNLTISCEIGMATAAVIYRLHSGSPREVTVTVPLGPSEAEEKQVRRSPPPARTGSWNEEMLGCPELHIPDERLKFLFDAAVRTIILHAPHDVFPGPYTYKRFWFRDAAFIANALLCCGKFSKVRRVLDTFPSRQTRNGYFLSQEGEWDSNGQALWILQRYCAVAHEPPPPEWKDSIDAAVRWIRDKRLPADAKVPHAGLLPAGFSAEHLGLNDYYYWDDYWAVAGLQKAAELLRAYGDLEGAERAIREAESLQHSVRMSVERAIARNGIQAIPASPYRRMDAGAVGSLAAGYPLQLVAEDDPALLGTARFLCEFCSVRGAFFQDMIHSGQNAYLTLHLAQVLLRAGEAASALGLLQVVRDLASPTGQWPEAIHPRTGGGCMGDGQHAWAAAELVIMAANLFVREERDTLILGSGIPERWLDAAGSVSLGPVYTKFGPVSVELTAEGGQVRISWEARWHDALPTLRVAVPGFVPATPDPEVGAIQLERVAS